MDQAEENFNDDNEEQKSIQSLDTSPSPLSPSMRDSLTSFIRFKSNRVNNADSQQQWGVLGSKAIPLPNKTNNYSISYHETISKMSTKHLRKHLAARNDFTGGNRKQLCERLILSCEEERLAKIAFHEELENRHRKIADKEEQGGAVYVCGSNQDGQLGLGHCRDPNYANYNSPNNNENDINHWEVIPMTRGLGVKTVSSGYNITFAVTENHRVYTWGGARMGPSGLKPKNDKREMQDAADAESDSDTENKKKPSSSYLPFTKPRIISELNGEEIIHVSTRANSHVCALSEGGDLYVWGHGRFGTLGLGADYNNNNYSIHTATTGTTNLRSNSSTQQHKRKKQNQVQVFHTPQIMNTFRKSDVIIQASVGELHCTVCTQDGEMYTWGHTASGRLGLDLNSTKKDILFHPAPSLIQSIPSSIKISKVSCGAEHTIALADEYISIPDTELNFTTNRIFSWGSGDGGRLGHGDCFNRNTPHPISFFDTSTDKSRQQATTSKRVVLDISAGTWHSACVILVPPLENAGHVYTWGSGYHGQLGQEDKTISLTPNIVQDFCDSHVYCRTVVCGPYHNAAISYNGELYTWGSNVNGCLGRSISHGEINIKANKKKKSFQTFTSHPGHCPTFGTIVNRIGRGLPRSVSCGKEFTVVATFPYTGPDEKTALKLMSENKKIEEIEMKKQIKRQTQLDSMNQRIYETKKQFEEIKFLTAKRRCILDPNCPGFQAHASKPSICKECGHSSVYHTILVDSEENDEPTCKAGNILDK